MKKPQNCGTTYCSCIECVVEKPSIEQFKTALLLARQALESTETDDFSDQFDLEEKALTAIDFALERL